MQLNPDQAARLADELLKLDGDPSSTDDLGLVGVPCAGAALPGSRLGNYRITRLLGVGGMGEVYEAEQESTRRRVALKLVRGNLLSPELRRRFDHEVRILASLQHPGIAQIYEAGQMPTPGAADGAPTGVPYFAMEYIEGQPLTTFASTRNLASRERLDLFLRVCVAVEHAHQKGVIHRDLKPANILVAAPPSTGSAAGTPGTTLDPLGHPKVLDFGVARAVDSDIAVTSVHTEVGKLVGTLPYMSPEQTDGHPESLDTRSDVYALGVVLYELLSGKLPYELKGDAGARVANALRIIREVDPAPLSSIDRVFRGDIDTIVAKALEKDRARRYQSVGELAADIRRHLDDEPIVARRATAWYQLLKLARRNRVPTALTLSATVIVTASLFMSVILWRAEAAAREAAERAFVAETGHRTIAERREKQSREVASFLRETLAAVNPDRSGPSVRLVDILDEASLKVAPLDADQAARIRMALGESYLGLGEFSESEIQLRAALKSWELARWPEPQEIVQCQVYLAQAIGGQDRHAEAVELLRQTLEYTERAVGAERAEFADVLNDLALAHLDVGDSETAERLARRALETRQATIGPRDVRTAISAGNLASILSRRNKHDEAERLHEQALAAFREIVGEHHHSYATALQSYGRFLLGVNRPSDAEKQLARSYDLRTSLLGPHHPLTLTALDGVAEALRMQKKYTEARPMFELAYRLRKETLGEHSLPTLLTLHGLGKLAFNEGRFDDAETTLRTSTEGVQALLGVAHRRTYDSLVDLADFYRLRGRHAEAITANVQVKLSASQVFGAESCEVGRASLLKGESHAKLGEIDLAETEFLLAESCFDSCGLKNKKLLQRALLALKSLYEASGKPDRAAHYQGRADLLDSEAPTSPQPPR